MKPCPIVQDCPCSGNPLTNFSSEAPDQDVFLGFNTGWDNNGPNPGDSWTNPDGYAFCQSPVSQEAADLCAANCQIGNQIDGTGPDCNSGGDGTNGDGPGIAPDPGNRGGTTLYGSSAQSCSVTCPDGTQFTYTLPANSIRSTNPTLVDTIAQSIACQRANAKQICLSSIVSACVNDEYEQTISVGDNVAAPVTFLLISGMLPPGISVDFDPFGGRAIDLIGTPTTPGNYSFTIQATDAEGNVMEKAYTLAVLGITNSPTASTQANPYSFQFTAAGGTAPYIFSLVGSLPAGLTLSASGLISGTPTGTDPATFTAQVEDDEGDICGTQFTMTPQTGIFWNTERSCPGGQNGPKIPAHTYSSLVSVADANATADTHLICCAIPTDLSEVVAWTFSTVSGGGSGSGAGNTAVIDVAHNANPGSSDGFLDANFCNPWPAYNLTISVACSGTGNPNNPGIGDFASVVSCAIKFDGVQVAFNQWTGVAPTGTLAPIVAVPQDNANHTIEIISNCFRKNAAFHGAVTVTPAVP